ncbi:MULTISPECIES: hypothetical protein [Providencia]|uniref:Lipoprotein n=1 Tax=Providencia stuartii TaxID=588 RepID=A0AAI9HYB7_PROST|nr:MULTISPECIES: hypothetical protein [Providencia]ELR5044504.1 hypothetical protein [Providencia rettgeri]ELR5034818.1 hypothetical protein [Providencia stuartii]ELR5292523.1 hypothetical protein [Providencia stuartii]MCR4181202.1 hypothetical protein [Providencia vermicola]URE79462.1 hypothetical protein MWH14_03825 [Providencia stuartii]
MKFKMLASLAIAATFLAGCDNNQTASESNFKKSIQDYLDTKQAICINTGAFPAGFLAQSNATKIEQLNSLVDAGLLNKSEKEIVIKDMWGKEKSGEGVEFTLTNEGQKFFDETKAEFSGRGSFCTGKLVVTEVTNFTEPAERGGQKISIANFKQKIEDVAPWAKNEKVIAAYPQIKSAQERAEKSQQSPLVLTNNGWIHIALFNAK